MKLLTAEQKRQLLANGNWNKARIAKKQRPDDFRPVLKLFCRRSSATWLLSELDPDKPTIAYGLCDRGHGTPELGRVSLTELGAVRGPGGLVIERDRHFRPVKTLEAYANEARRRRRGLA
jgi:hypothetical protein